MHYPIKWYLYISNWRGSYAIRTYVNKLLTLSKLQVIKCDLDTNLKECDNMTIKEVAEKYNITQDTLRYYERVKMIPEVHRTKGGIRDYQEDDLKWVELALCMRSAGLPIETIIEYLRLFQEGDETIPARLELLKSQMEVLTEQKKQIETTMERLSYKITVYEKAKETGILKWKE